MLYTRPRASLCATQIVARLQVGLSRCFRLPSLRRGGRENALGAKVPDTF